MLLVIMRKKSRERKTIFMIMCPVALDMILCPVALDVILCPVDLDVIMCPVALDMILCPVALDVILYPVVFDMRSGCISRQQRQISSKCGWSLMILLVLVHIYGGGFWRKVDVRYILFALPLAESWWNLISNYPRSLLSNSIYEGM